MGGKIPWADWAPIFLKEGIPDVITWFKFGDDRFRGLASAEGQILPSPIDFDGRPYNTLTTVWACDLTTTNRLIRFFTNDDWQRGRFENFESDHQYESNLESDVRFEIELNHEASQVPN